MRGFNVTVDEVKAEMNQGRTPFFIDARNQEDWDRSDQKVQGAIRIPTDELERQLDTIPRDRTIITY